LHLVSQTTLVLVKLELESLLLLVEDLLALEKHIIVESKLLLVELVDRLHVLHTLLQNLHFSLKFDLLFGLLVGVLAHDVLELLSILFFLLLALKQKVVLDTLVLLEEVLNLLLVAGKDLATLLVKFTLD